MPREASISFEQVAAIADAIQAAGGKPTPRQVRERHGSGSLGTIHKHFQKWKSGQERQVLAAPVLPAGLQRAILDFMGQELAGARAGLETQLAESQQAAAELAEEGERQAGRIEALEAALEALQAQHAGLEGRAAQLETDTAAAREQAAVERGNAERLQTELAKAELRLEALPRLEGELEAARMRAVELAAALEQCAVERARAQVLAEEREQALAHCRSRAVQLEAELAAEREQAAAERRQLLDRLHQPSPELNQIIQLGRNIAEELRAELAGVKAENQVLREKMIELLPAKPVV